MTGFSTANQFDRTGLARAADGLAVIVAVSMPWSTSATGILLVLWLLALIPTLDWADLRRTIATPAGGLPVLLFLLGVAGMLWADVTLIERWKGLDSFFKLLAIPLLLAQFRRSDHGLWVFAGYLLSCVVLLVASTVVAAIPPLSLALMQFDRVLVKNAATQSGEFVTCMFGLLYFAIEAFEQRLWWRLAGLLAVVFGMLTNIVFVATGRTALAVIPILLVLLVARKLSGKAILVVFACAVMVGSLGWYSSPYLRDRTVHIWTDFQSYEATDERNSSGERIEFWRKAVGFVRDAPVFGHGTGTIASLFEKSVVGKSGAAASTTANPHNQTFAVAIQLGFIGVIVLWAMWIAHLFLFRGFGAAEWIGFMIVVQNFVGSLFNSHLFDFAQGWVYVIGVGVAGGVALKNRAVDKSASLTS
jgi:O-antigen ligase